MFEGTQRLHARTKRTHTHTSTYTMDLLCTFCKLLCVWPPFDVIVMTAANARVVVVVLVVVSSVSFVSLSQKQKRWRFYAKKESLTRHNYIHTYIRTTMTTTMTTTNKLPTTTS